VHAAPDVGHASVSKSEFFVELDGFFVHRDGIFKLALAQIIAPAQEEIVSLRIVGGLARDDFFFLRRERDFQGLGDAERDFFLNGEHVFHLTVIALGPDGMARAAFDELRGDTQAIAGSPDGPFEDVHGAELFADLRCGDRLVAEGKHFRAREDL
jgi:hypothetical protein